MFGGTQRRSARKRYSLFAVPSESMAGGNLERHRGRLAGPRERGVVGVGALFFGGLGLLIAMWVPLLGGAALNWPDDVTGGRSQSPVDYLTVGLAMVVPAAVSGVLIVLGVLLALQALELPARAGARHVVGTMLGVWLWGVVALALA
jgi:hypothetical protein